MKIKKEQFYNIEQSNHKNKLHNISLMRNPFKYNKFNLSKGQRTCAMILESNGIAISGYEKEINCIIDIIYEYVKQYGMQTVGFDINDLLVQNGFNTFSHIAKILNLNVFFDNDDTQASYIDSYTKYQNRVINEMTIQLILNKTKFQSQQLLISQLLFHEFNHAYEDSQRIKNGEKTLFEILHDGEKSIDYDKIINDITDDNMSIPYILYRLFVATELNALPAQLYGELQIIKPNIETFTLQVKQTQTYDIYQTCKNYYDEYIKNVNILPNNIRKYFPKKNKLSDSQFLKWFKIQYKSRLQKLWYKLWKAGYYYFNK